MRETKTGFGAKAKFQAEGDSNQKTRVTKEMKRKKVMKMESIKTTKKMKKVTIISDMSKYFLKFNFTPYYCIIIN
jgi:hypothetical protein